MTSRVKQRSHVYPVQSVRRTPNSPLRPEPFNAPQQLEKQPQSPLSEFGEWCRNLYQQLFSKEN